MSHNFKSKSSSHAQKNSSLTGSPRTIFSEKVFSKICRNSSEAKSQFGSKDKSKFKQDIKLG